MWVVDWVQVLRDCFRQLKSFEADIEKEEEQAAGEKNIVEGEKRDGEGEEAVGGEKEREVNAAGRAQELVQERIRSMVDVAQVCAMYRNSVQDFIWFLVHFKKSGAFLDFWCILRMKALIETRS